MSRRVIQFGRALLSRKELTGEARGWVKSHLPPAQVALFDGMALIDRQHAFRVAQSVKRLAPHHGIEDPGEISLLVKAALLHDIGKSLGKLTLSDRVAIVLLHRFFPRMELKTAGPQNTHRHSVFHQYLDRLRLALQIDAEHPHKGALMAESAGAETAVVDLIRHHQDRRAGREKDRLLDVLQEADRKA